MFVATVINFLLSSLNTGDQLAQFIMFIRKALILSENPGLVDGGLLGKDVINMWAEYLPVSSMICSCRIRVPPNNGR